jgi:hypothetical protein
MITLQNIKEELHKDMEKLKKNHTEILEIKSPFSQRNTVEGHSSRQEQVEDRISELKDKI